MQRRKKTSAVMVRFTILTVETAWQAYTCQNLSYLTIKKRSFKAIHNMLIGGFGIPDETG